MIENAVIAHREIDVAEPSWYAIYTVVRHEKSVNTALTDKEIDTFLPIKKVLSRWKDRKKEIDIPLFPGYVFANSSLENRLKILNTRGVIQILGVNGYPTPVPNEQIESIKRLLEADLHFDPYPFFKEGLIS